jgi:hypothetical protein
MTSIATIAGAIPPALAIGPGAELQRPMAVSVVGGMMLSTLFTLFVVPSAYSLLDDVVTWNADRRRGGEPLWGSLAHLGQRIRMRPPAAPSDQGQPTPTP